MVARPWHTNPRAGVLVLFLSTLRKTSVKLADRRPGWVRNVRRILLVGGNQPSHAVWDRFSGHGVIGIVQALLNPLVQGIGNVAAIMRRRPNRHRSRRPSLRSVFIPIAHGQTASRNVTSECHWR